MKLHNQIESLGVPSVTSPLTDLYDQAGADFVSDDQRILFNDLESARSIRNPVTLEVAGPRRYLFFNPSSISAAIVTCGGICPGLNNVIRGVVLALRYTYGVKNIFGIKYGFQGFVGSNGADPILLTPEMVSEINATGGTILGSSRGPQSSKLIIDRLVQMDVQMLFVVGGDGTLRAGQELVKEVRARRLPISIVAIPKTIDNDFECMDKSFGFETAVTEAVRSVLSAHVEAKGARNGIGLVKLMGRESGFIAAHTALAANCANFVLVPEVPFEMEGEDGLLQRLEDRLRDRGHAVIIAAEGAGQQYFKGKNQSFDPSGNPRLGDIGTLLKNRIAEHFHKIGQPMSLKLIDPSYDIRSIPANAQDSAFCTRLAQNAVHAAMAGKTGLVVGRWHQHFVHLPSEVATATRRQVDPTGDLWMSILELTGQPSWRPEIPQLTAR